MRHVAAHDQAGVYLRVLRRWWWLPVVFAMLSSSVSYVATRVLLKPVYGATISLQIQPLTTNNPQYLPVAAADIAKLMTSASTLARVETHLSGSAKLDPKALYRTGCLADQVTNHFVTCSTTSPYPLTAAKTLNTLAAVFIPYYKNLIRNDFNQTLSFFRHKISVLSTHEKTLQTQMKKLIDHGQGNSPEFTALSGEATTISSSLNQFEMQKANLQTVYLESEGTVNLTSPAPYQAHQVAPHPARNAALGFIVGIGIAAALIVLLEYMDDSFRSTDEVASATGLPVLGAVRRYEGPADEMGLVAARMPRTAIAEAYRVARANVQFTSVNGDIRVLVVTSARDGEGKTTTANNLATTFALAGQRVLLVDADLRRPGLTRMMGMKDRYGLSSALIEPGVNVIEPTEVLGLSIVPSGPVPPNPAELLGSKRMHDWIEENTHRFDILIFDTPPILSVADTRVLSALADGVVMVLDPNLTTRRMVKQARGAIENVGGRVIGILLNRDTMRGEGYYYNYYYYERYAREEREHATL